MKINLLFALAVIVVLVYFITKEDEKVSFLKVGKVMGRDAGLLDLDKYKIYKKVINKLYKKKSDNEILISYNNVLNTVNDFVIEKLKNGYVLGIGLQEDDEKFKNYIKDLNNGNLTNPIGGLFLYNKNKNEFLGASPDTQLQFVDPITLGAPEEDINVLKNDIKNLLN
jgi:hypothetical protein